MEIGNSLMPTATQNVIVNTGSPSLFGSQIHYEKYGLTRVCLRGGCPELADEGHKYCKRHLREMRAYTKKRREQLIAAGLCTRCAVRPGFWGRLCIVCRESKTRKPLPLKAMQALRAYREKEFEQTRDAIRVAAGEFLAGNTVGNRTAQALRLYLGLDGSHWRTYREVGELMNLTEERVRQLLSPAKVALALRVTGQPHWRNLGINTKRQAQPEKEMAERCNHSKVRVFAHRSYVYQESGLSNVTLTGTVVFECLGCKSERAVIPKLAELNKILANAILCKPGPLTGQELKFLRTVAGLDPAELGYYLSVTKAAISYWEASRVLRFTNDIPTRLVLASQLAHQELFGKLSSLIEAIRSSTNPHGSRLTVCWLADEARWQLVELG